MSSAITDERRGRVPLEMYADTRPPLDQLEEQQRARRDFVGVADVEAAAVGQVRHVRVGDELPALALRRRGERELHHVLPAVEDDEQRRLLGALADAALLRAAVEQHGEAARVRIVPFLRAHLVCRLLLEKKNLDAELLVVDAGEEALLPQDRILLPQAGELLDEADQPLRGLVELPVDPGELVVLAIGVVVALLRARELI